MLISTFSSIHLSNIFERLLQIKLSLATKENKELILLGDLNVNYSSKQDHKEIKDIFTLNGMSQVINDTRFDIHHNTSTLIDVIFEKNDFAVTRTSGIPMSIGDHDMVGCIYKLNNARFSQKNIHCRDYRNYDPLLMNRDIRQSRLNEVDKIKNINDAWNHIKNILLEVFQKHAPIINKRVRGKPCPWLTNDLKSKMNTRDQLLRKIRKIKLQFDINAYKAKRNEVNIALRKVKSKYFKNLLSENTNSPKKFWQTLKLIFSIKNKSNNSKSFLIENEFTSVPSKIATGFANFYTNIAIKSFLLPLNNIIWRKSPKCNNFKYKTFKFRYVSAKCISKQLKRPKRNKSCGIDSLPPNLLKDSANEITYALTYLVNLSLSTATFPSEWKTAKITPVFKSGNKTDIENYRPISILSVISKIMEREVHSQLYYCLEEGKLISDFQFGFRKSKSTEQAILTLLNNIRNSVDSGKLVVGCTSDLSKAFDTISHRKLLEKLECYGVQDKELEWFRNYLFDRHIRVCFDGVLSEKRPVFTGVF